MTDDPAPQSRRAMVRAERKARLAAKIARRESYFDLLTSGYSCHQIAKAMEVGVSTVRRVIDEAIAERRLDAPERHVRVQVARLSKALRLADEGIDRGDLKAAALLIRLVAALDRYQAPVVVSPPPAPPQAPPPALPTPRRALTFAGAPACAPLTTDDAMERSSAEQRNDPKASIEIVDPID